MATTADFKNGLCLEFQGEIYTIVSFQHVKPGKGGAFVRTKLKGLTSGKVIDHTFNAGVKVTTARVERRAHQFLYQDAEGCYFMDTQSFEQIRLDAAAVGALNLLKEGQEVQVLIHQETGQVLTCEMPTSVELQVSYTEPGFKGDTATKTLKAATLETGAHIQVPLFINNGDMVRVDTRDGSYMERVK